MSLNSTQFETINGTEIVESQRKMADMNAVSSLLMMYAGATGFNNPNTTMFINEMVKNYQQSYEPLMPSPIPFRANEITQIDDYDYFGRKNMNMSVDEDIMVPEQQMVVKEEECIETSLDLSMRSRNTNTEIVRTPARTPTRKRKLEPIIDRLSSSALLQMLADGNFYSSTPKAKKLKFECDYSLYMMVERGLAALGYNLSKKSTKMFAEYYNGVGLESFISILLQSTIPRHQFPPFESQQRQMDMPRICLPPPVVPRWTSGDKRAGLTDDVIILFDKFERASEHAREDYCRDKMFECPLDFEYNPNKSRLRREYGDETVKAERAKNNLASRQSRIKKKMSTQLIKWDVEYHQEENREFFNQERFMTLAIKQLEEEINDVNLIMKLRQECGMK